MTKPSMKSLYWRISAVFLLVLILLGVAFNYLSLFSAEMYFQEGNQRLHREFAYFVADMLRPSVGDTLKRVEIMHVFEDVHRMNPSVEVYLLDEQGKILLSSARPGDLKLTHIDVKPIHAFLATGGKEFTMGEDPTGTHKEKVFTTAPLSVSGRGVGYVYVILGGEEYDSALEFIQQNYILRLGVRTLLISLIGAAIIGLVILGFLTRRLREMTGTAIAFGAGDLSRRVTVVRDDEIGKTAAAFNSMADTIQQHLDQLSSMDTLRRELIANVSHDLRTPLSALQGYVETVLLKNDILTAAEREVYLQTILESTTRLNKLVEELFELSKLDARQTLPRSEPFSITELLHDIVQKVRPLAERKSVSLEIGFEKDLPFVHADIGMIERVLQNLIENGIKFTAEGGKMNLSVERHHQKVMVRVADSGVGIPTEDLPHIFDRFFRVSNSRSQPNGAGLGLAIVKKILELHGEQIAVESHVNKGSEFSFSLPLHHA